MLTGKGKKSYARSMVIYLTIGLVLLGGIIGGLVFWYILQPQFKTLITYLILVPSVLVIYFIIFRGIFLSRFACYGFDGDLFIIKDGYPSSKQITVKISQIDKVSITRAKTIFFRGLATVKICVSNKTYKLKNICRQEAEKIKQRLEGQNEI
jgi:membrane protein YdbS with pleckstrin-like domain